MPYPKAFVRLSWLFSIVGTDEVAETGLHVSTLGTTPFDAVAHLGHYTAAYGTANCGRYVNMIHGATGLLWADYSKLVGFKAAAVGTDGHYLAAPFMYDNSAVNDNGNHTPVPPQGSIACTLRAATTFGQANYGRMYLPHTMFTYTANTPAASATVTQSIGNEFKTFIGLQNTDANSFTAGSAVVNMSQKNLGTVKAVSSVSVGSILDTQRRRRNRLDEVYFSVAL